MQKIIFCNLTVLMTILLVADVPGQDQFIEVVGSANLKSPADLVEIRTVISGTGETAKTAIKVFEEKKEEFEGSLSVMNFPDAKITYEGPQIINGQVTGAMQMQQMFNDGAAAQVEKFACEEVAVVQIPVESLEPIALVKKIAKIVDAAVSAKATIGGNVMEFAYTGEAPEGMTKLLRSDVKSLQKKATKLAFEDAKRQAEELAALSGLKLGSVLSVRTTSEPEIYLAMPVNQDESGVDITKNLTVRFRVK